MKSSFRPARLAAVTLIVQVVALRSGLTAPGNLKWICQTDGAVRSSPALGTNGWVYFGSLDGHVYAVDGATGEKKWSSDVGIAVNSSPAITDSGAILIGADVLWALHPTTGQMLWSSGVSGVYSSPTISTNGLAYITCWDGLVAAIDVDTGQTRWDISLNSSQVYGSVAIGANATVYCGTGRAFGNSDSPAQSFLALSALTGEIRWSFASVNMIQATPAIGADGTVYIPGYDKLLYALDAKTGQEKWRHLCGDSMSSSPALGPDGTIFVGCNDGNLYAINSSDGSEKWRFPTGDTIHSSPALASDGAVYFGSYDRNIYGVDGRTGREKWHFTTGGLVLSSPLIGKDGTVFIGCMDGKLYAIEGSAPLAKSDWPEFRNGGNRTGSAEMQTEADTNDPQVVAISATANNINLKVQTKAGHLHTVESKPSLDKGEWTTVRTFTGTGWNEIVSDGRPVDGSLFYRLRVD